VQVRKLWGWIALALLLTGCHHDPEAAKRRFLQLGNKYYETGKYKEASILYRKALNEDRRYGEAYYRLGLTNLKLGNRNDAGRAFLRAFQLEPDNLAAFRHLAQLYLLALTQPVVPRREEVLADLIRHTEQAEQLHPGAFEVLYVKGQIALYQNQAQQAVPLLRRALAVNPWDANATLALATALAAQNQVADVEKTLRQSLEHNKTQLALYNFLYVVYANQGRTAEAEAVLKDACENNPDEWAAWINLANHYRNAGKSTEIKAVLDRLLNDPERFPNAPEQVGDFYLRGGQADLAIKYYREGMKAEPKREREYRYRIVQAYLAARKFQEATGEVDGLLATDPNDALALGLRGALRLRSGAQEDTSAALEDLKTAVSRLPANAVLRYQLGLAYLESGDQMSAREQFLEAVRQTPEYLLPQYALIDLHLQRNEFTRAEVLANDILNRHPYDASARLGRAMAWIGLREYDKARSELESLIEKKQRLRDATFQLARLEVIEKKYAAAEKRFRALAEADPSDIRVVQELIDLQMVRGRPDRAQYYLDQEITKHPDRLPLRLAAAELAITRGDLNRAIEELRFVLAREPGNGPANNRLGEICLRKGDTQTARAHFDKAMEADPPVPEAFLHVGTLLAREGKLKEARPYFDRCIQLAPDNDAALNNLAYILAEMGTDLDQALTYAQRAVAKKPDSADYADTLGYVYLKRNLNQNAIEVLRRIVAEHPARASFRYHLAMALYQKGNQKQARTELETALKSNPSPEETRRIRELLARLES